MSDLNHILCNSGILKELSISKTISEKELKKIRAKIKVKKSSDKYNDLLYKEILNYTAEFIKKNKIPGSIPPKETVKNVGDDTRKILAEVAVSILKKLKPKKLSPQDACFFIMELVNGFELTDDDFDRFNDESEGEDDSPNLF